MQNEPSQIIKNMYELVREKDYFVVTTTGVDHFIPAGFLSERVFEMEEEIQSKSIGVDEDIAIALDKILKVR